MAEPGEIRVAPVRDDAALQQFLQLPWRIYQDDPYWVPPILSHQRDFLDPRRGPFFEIGEAEYFLAFHQGQPAGRISAHVNRLHDKYHGPESGFFGFFESIPDQRVADALLEAAAAWLRAHGKTRILGPLNFCIYDEMGLLVEGFDSMPVLMQTHNPPYYQDLLTAWGFRKAMDWHAYKLTNRNVDLAAMEQRVNAMLREHQVTVATYHRREVARRGQEVFDLFNDAWRPLWGHVPLTRRQFDNLFNDLKHLLRPGLAFMLLAGNRLVGFTITVPDINPLVKELNGQLSLWGKLRLLYWAKFKPVRKIRGLVMGVSKPYQGKRLHLAMVLQIYLHIVKHTPCDFCDFSLIPEDLYQWIRGLKALGAQRYKVFRVFARDI